MVAHGGARGHADAAGIDRLRACWDNGGTGEGAHDEDYLLRSFLFRGRGEWKHLLFDPFITPNGLRAIDPGGPGAGRHDPAVHAHEDHVADAVAIAKRTQARVLSNFEIDLWLTRQGVKHLCPMNLGGTARLERGIEAKLVPALHSSSLPDGSYGGTAAGWVVRTAEGNFYYSGDTALMSDMKLIGESVKLNWAALCIGDTFTMGVEDAIRAAALVGCDQVLGVHYDTFPRSE